jgi:hypothetical protein
MRAAMASNIAATVLVKKSNPDPRVEIDTIFQEQELDEYLIEEE